jgi:M6 family metalloprotease-like protein
LLVIAVRFPGTVPTLTLEQIQEKIGRVDGYIRNASYGKAWLEPKLAGWYDMPAGVDAYKVSPYNYNVDPARVRRLVADAVGAAQRDVNLGKYDLVWIVVGVFTYPGQGYGMICYAANPGMLSKGLGRGEFRPQLETVALTGGGSFAKPVTVSAENAHVGHAVHDLLHALGGLKDGRRVLPDLYDFWLQSHPPGGSGFMLPPETYAIHTGSWDIMSQHFIERTQPPPAPSSFTRLRMGWIAPEQVVSVKAGETREVVLSPLSSGKDTLVIRVPLAGERYLLVENRQRSGDDAVQRAAGMLVLEVDPSRAEGSAIVHTVDANPSVPRLYAAPFLPGAGERRYYANAAAGIAVIPLELATDGSMRVMVTTPDRAKQWRGD